MKFYLNLVTEKTHTNVEWDSRVYAVTHLWLCGRNRSQSVLLFIFYLVIIEFNDLANEQNSDSHHNNKQDKIKNYRKIQFTGRERAA